jgi:hypothetical protein
MIKDVLYTALFLSLLGGIVLLIPIITIIGSMILAGLVIFFLVHEIRTMNKEEDND